MKSKHGERRDPGLRLGPISRRLLASAAAAVVAAVTIAGEARSAQATAVAGEFDLRRSRTPRSPPDLPGTDIALVGGPGWNTLPVAFSRGDGTFTVTNESVGAFAAWSTGAGVAKLVADFNGDRKTDVALLGGAGWRTVPVAFSRGDGSFLVTNQEVVVFASFASRPGTVKLAGDFNGDRKTDLAVMVDLYSHVQLELAYSNGDGTFNDQFAGPWNLDQNARWQVGDFNGDGKADLQAPQCSSSSIAVIHSRTPTAFFQAASYPGAFADWACRPGSRLLLGRFNADPLTDLLLLGAPNPDQAAVAFFQPYPATFVDTVSDIGEFGSWALDPAIQTLVADFDGDGLSDVALLGEALWPFLPVAFSNGDGTFRVTTDYAGDFPGWSSTWGATALVGDYNNDGKADIALTGGVGWDTLPVAFSNGDGTFRVTNQQIDTFARWAAP